jgi:hypothetical protein
VRSGANRKRKRKRTFAPEHILGGGVFAREVLSLAMSLNLLLMRIATDSGSERTILRTASTANP